MRAHPSKMLSVAVFAVLSSCVRQIPVRASSNDRVPVDQARFQVPADVLSVERALQDLAAREGLKLAQKVVVKTGGTVWVFKGHRTQTLSARSGAGVVAVETHGIGSWVAARVTGTGATTNVWLLGKPTVDGTEICSDADTELADVEYWCRDTLIRDDFENRALLSGQVESEIVLRLSEAMRQGFRGTAPKVGTTEL